MEREEVLALSNAMTYFQTAIDAKVAGKELEVHLDVFLTLLDKNKQMKGPIIFNLMELVIKRYYQFCMDPSSTTL